MTFCKAVRAIIPVSVNIKWQEVILCFVFGICFVYRLCSLILHKVELGVVVLCRCLATLVLSTQEAVNEMLPLHELRLQRKLSDMKTSSRDQLKIIKGALGLTSPPCYYFLFKMFKEPSTYHN